MASVYKHFLFIGYTFAGFLSFIALLLVLFLLTKGDLRKAGVYKDVRFFVVK